MEYVVAIIESIWITILIVIGIVITLLIIGSIAEWVDNKIAEKNMIKRQEHKQKIKDIQEQEERNAQYAKDRKKTIEETKKTPDRWYYQQYVSQLTQENLSIAVDLLKNTGLNKHSIWTDAITWAPKAEWPAYLQPSNRSQWTAVADKYKDTRNNNTYFPNWITDVDIQREWGNDVSIGVDFGLVDWGMLSWVYKKVPLANEDKIIKTEPSIYL
jgi:hypothetical protein